MGKRKSSKKPQPKKATTQTLDKSFRCLFCQHAGTVSCKMDPKTHMARLSCRDCQQHFSVEYNHLTQPVDVYATWIDACQAVNEGRGGAGATLGTGGRKRPVQDTAGQDERRNRPSSSARPAAASSTGQRRRQSDEEEDESDSDEDLPDIIGQKRLRLAEKAAAERKDQDDQDDDEAPAAQRRRVVQDDDDDD